MHVAEFVKARRSGAQSMLNDERTRRREQQRHSLVVLAGDARTTCDGRLLERRDNGGRQCLLGGAAFAVGFLTGGALAALAALPPMAEVSLSPRMALRQAMASRLHALKRWPTYSRSRMPHIEQKMRSPVL